MSFLGQNFGGKGHCNPDKIRVLEMIHGFRSPDSNFSAECSLPTLELNYRICFARKGWDALARFVNGSIKGRF